jgi:hypothetical protein
MSTFCEIKPYIKELNLLPVLESKINNTHNQVFNDLQATKAFINRDGVLVGLSGYPEKVNRAIQQINEKYFNIVATKTYPPKTQYSNPTAININVLSLFQNELIESFNEEFETSIATKNDATSYRPEGYYKTDFALKEQEEKNLKDETRIKGAEGIRRELLQSTERRNFDRLQSNNGFYLEKGSSPIFLSRGDSNKKDSLSSFKKQENDGVSKVYSNNTILSVVQEKLSDTSPLNGRLFEKLNSLGLESVKVVVDNKQSITFDENIDDFIDFNKPCI